MRVVVVGAGISGLSAAFHLLERGLGPVTVVDAAGIGAGASRIAPGGVRQQWGSRAGCLVARESYRVYLRLAERLGARVAARFDPCGYLFLADRAETLAQLEANVAIQRDAGVPSEVMTPARIAELVRGLRPGGAAGGAYCAEDGYFDRPQAVVTAFADAARRLGATFERAEVRALERDGAGWRVVADAGAYATDAVVVAASTGTRGLVAPLGVELPIVCEPRYLLLSEPRAERILEPLVIAVDRGVAAKQLADGRLLASDLRATGEPGAAADGWRTNVRRVLADLLPAAAGLPLPTVVEGFYDTTPDAQPIVDEVADGLWVAAGFSGHGFMLAPSTGSLVAAGVAGDELPAWHEAFALDRFARRGERNPDPQVI
ncbi:MAG TPA: FAD-binding oxidoreductase [Gaiellaceae bacterium]|nr:FAD-binding oxidoreductase [Gaiellaceae bacterium]